MSMDDPIPQHIAAIAAGRDVAPLLRASRSADHTVPAARDWVRRWGPSPFAAEAPSCACAAGRCPVCN